MMKALLVSLGFIALAPHLAIAQSQTQYIQDQVTRERVNPIINPKWGSFLLRTDRLKKLYSYRGYQAIWVDSKGSPNSMVMTLKDILLSADRHGLNPADYWDAQLEKGYQATLKAPGVQWITFELLATEALIRYVTHLSTGRFDPEFIDSDIKFKRKEFTKFAELNAAVSYGSNSLSHALDAFAPSHPRYKDLMDILVKLKDMKNRGGWRTINSPGFALKLGVKDPSVGLLRQRFNEMGYRISTYGGNTFDSEFDAVLRKFQAANGLTADGIIGTRSEVLRALNFTPSQRIAQVEVTMEKLRWLPDDVEQRHIFVNLATTEFQLFDENGKMFHFNAVAGQSFRRTPSMRDQITYVNLNPYWTVPRSIAIRDKLPLLKRDPNYLQRNNMILVDEATDQVINPATIDWRNMTAKNFVYYIRQMPGPDNALGVVKFPLQNPWAIYMHDTNEKQLFQESKRHRSSGCVRLEKPLELAAYLLQDQPGWSLWDIQRYVPMYSNQIPGQIDKRVSLRKPMPVYFMYLTVEKGENGSLRFIDDVYGQDTRVSKAIQSRRSAEADLAQAPSLGTLQVRGEAGSQQLFQKVQAVRCEARRRGSCDAPVYFELNQKKEVAVGDYIVGFENSIYPVMVRVNAGEVTTLHLEKITVPSQVRGQKIRVYRDFTSLVEQEKIYMTMFAMNRHFFRLDKDNFGDLYVAGLWERDFVQRFTYEICPKLGQYGEVESAAKKVCNAWNEAQEPRGLRELFNFASDGTFQEMWVTFPGDVIPSKHPRYLVSAPMRDNDFVSVFPGVYKVQAEGKNMPAVTVVAGPVSQNSSSFDFSLNAIRSFISLDGEDCHTATTWKTDRRAYCNSDRLEGCDRSTARSCEPM